MTKFKHLPTHPLTFAVFPILALLAHNVRQVEPQVALRPLLVSVSVAALLLALLGLLLRSWTQAALVTSFLLFLFFSYGHVYQFLEMRPIFGFVMGRHRTLLPLYGLVLIAGIWLILVKVKSVTGVTHYLNLIGIVLLVFPVIQITSFSIRFYKSVEASQELREKLGLEPLHPEDPQRLPDIYYIIPDTYTRADALQADFGFDNSARPEPRIPDLHSPNKDVS